MESIAEQIARVGRLTFERRLTDTSGGNISARCGAVAFITPRCSGSRRYWQLTTEDIISGEINGDSLLSHPQPSREGQAHPFIYRGFPDAGAVIHAYPFHVLPFWATGRPIEPVLEGTPEFGVVELVKSAPAHSSELAENVLAAFRRKEGLIRKQAAAVLMPQHGLIVAGKDLFTALYAVERID